ncbi:MAG: UDP-2,3-diacylglucosamine diphosphatase [bacterium]|nr:UDP-2,3-diacylglucosamine diphosphatase [bacterium]
MARDKVYFISDAHLGAPRLKRNRREQEDSLIGFLRSIRDTAEVLYIVGDLFDFWFEYGSVVPKHGARVLFELYFLVQSGMRVVYLPGNHDVWPGPYMAEEVGLELTGGPVEVEHQGKRLYLAHGDEFRRDWKYRMSRAVIKNRFCIWLFRWLHPEVGVFFAQSTSHYSEERSKKNWNKKTNKQIYIQGARKKIEAGVDIVICGHYHRALVEQVGDGILVVLGDWIRRDTYAVLENGGIALKEWEGGIAEGR